MPSSTSCESAARDGLAASRVASKLVGVDLAIDVREKLLERALVIDDIEEPTIVDDEPPDIPATFAPPFDVADDVDDDVSRRDDDDDDRSGQF